MIAADEAKIAKLFNRERLWTATPVEDWFLPNEVRLIRPKKANRGRRLRKVHGRYSELFFSEPGPRTARPSPDLLERFLDLAEASDEAIEKFAARFGSLDVYRILWGPDFSSESSDVWRYLAVTMLSILKIAAQMYRGNPGSSADWDAVGKHPEIIEELHTHAGADRSESETVWYYSTRFVADAPTFRNRERLLELVNDLLALGRVRPRMRWPKDAPRPSIVYSSPSLLSYLTLQLALRVARMDAFVLCTNCRREYTPDKRAPKRGQRNFCPECRAKGIPKKYAISDYRDRKGSVKHGKTRTE